MTRISLELKFNSLLKNFCRFCIIIPIDFLYFIFGKYIVKKCFIKLFFDINKVGDRSIGDLMEKSNDRGIIMERFLYCLKL